MDGYAAPLIKPIHTVIYSMGALIGYRTGRRFRNEKVHRKQ